MTAIKKSKIYRVLVIDDNISIHEDFRKILLKKVAEKNKLKDLESELFGLKTNDAASVSFEIDCASQGSDGLEMAVKAQKDGNPYAVAFVDGRMPPGWDGIETIYKIWKDCPDLQMVFCTAYSDYSWQEIRGVLGDSDSLLILKKPFDNMEVLQLAHALASKWELNRQVKHQIENLDELVQRGTEEKNRARMLLEAALKYSPAGIIISNGDGTKILWANQAAEEIYGEQLIPPADYISAKGETGFNAYRTDGIPYTTEELPFLRSILNDEIVHNEILFLKNNHGIDKWISYNTAPIRNPDNEKVAVIIILNDISERKYTEIEHEKLRSRLAQMQKMESVGLLAGGVAHDYNNMLSVIIGNAELGMLSIDTSDPDYEIFKEIKKAAHRSSDLTQQLLAFARKQAIAPKVLDLNKKISDMRNILHRLIGENIDIFWEPGKDLWQVKFDPSQLDQVLFNLCVNSRDAINGVGKIYIETGNTTFSISDIAARPELKGGDYVALKIRDNGCGMKKEVLDRIFEPFFSTKEFGKGTGLGLATVYGIVRQNDGYIDVESEPGKGTAFTIYLPRFEGEVAESEFEKPDLKKSGKGEKILMVEDKEDVLDIGKSMLERLGYSVTIANGPEEALIQAEKMNGNIDLLITDVVMPGINGRELATKLQTLYPGLKCLFMSGYTADIISEHGVLDDGVHFLQKPFTFKSIASKVQALLNDGQDFSV